MNKYLIIGHGFIVSNLCNELSKTAQVTVIDKNAESLNNISSGVGHYMFDVSETDLLPVFEKEEFNGVFHLAAEADAQKTFENPRESFSDSVLSLENLLETCKVFKTPVVFASSAAVYGNQKRYSAHESDSFDMTSPYAMHKIICEMLCQGYNYFYNIPITALRLFNVFGPQNNKGVVHNIEVAKKTKTSFSLNGTGVQVRDYVHVSDVITAMIKSMNAVKGFQVYNVSSGKGTPVTDLLKYARLDSKIQTKPLPPETLHSVGGNEKIKRSLDWYPEHSVKNYLRNI